MQKRLFPRLLRLLMGGGGIVLFCFWYYFEPESELDNSSIDVATEIPQRNPANKPANTEHSQPAQNAQTVAHETSAAKGISERVQELETCIESRACNFPDTDPRSYDLAVGQKLAEAMRIISENSSPPTEEEIATARRLLLNPDGHVKAAALEVLAKSEPNEDALGALLEGILLEHDAKLLPRTLGILARYTDSASRTRIDQTMQRVLLRGSHYVSYI